MAVALLEPSPSLDLVVVEEDVVEKCLFSVLSRDILWEELDFFLAKLET